MFKSLKSVSKCFRLFQCVGKYLALFQIAVECPECFRLFQGVAKRSRLFHGFSKCDSVF